MVPCDVQALGVARRSRCSEGCRLGRERVFDVVAPYQLPCAGVCTPDLTQVAADFVFFGRIAAAWQQACRGDEVASGRRVRGHCVRHHDGVDDGAAVSASIDGEQCGPGRWFGGGEPPCLQAVRDGSEKSGETGDVVGTCLLYTSPSPRDS